MPKIPMLSLNALYDTAEDWSASVITLDAYDVTKDRATAALLGMLWQNLAECEFVADTMWWGHAGDDVQEVCFLLNQHGYLEMPVMRQRVTEGGGEYYNDDLTKDAARIARKTIVNLIYEVMNV